MSSKTGLRAPGHPLGIHRVIEPEGAMPQQAWRLDNTPAAADNEILCEVEALNIDSASFKQIAEECGFDPQRIGEHIVKIVGERGKQHNPVTGSGGMFVGRVLEVGEALREQYRSASGRADRFARIADADAASHRVDRERRRRDRPRLGQRQSDSL